jgi:hypothetical protein
VRGVAGRGASGSCLFWVLYDALVFFPLFVVCAADMIETSFSEAIEWAYPGVYPFDGSGGAVVVVNVCEVLLSCWRFRFGPSLVEISVFRLVSTGSFDWWCSRTFWVTFSWVSVKVANNFYPEISIPRFIA